MKKLLAIGLAIVAIAFIVGLSIYLRRPKILPTRVSDAVQQPKQLWTCGMHPQFIQDHPGNCPICHMKLTPLQSNGADAAENGGEKKVAYWWDPMLGPSSISSHPGKSAMGMDLVPVYDAQVQAGPGVRIDPVVVQNMGIRTAEVTRGPLTRTIQTVGVLEAPETGLHDISPKVSGWIEKLYANQDGLHVHKGDPLFDLYSPDLFAAEQELVVAVKAASDPSSRALVESAKSRLRLLDVSDEDINAVAASAVAPKAVTFRSPVSGAVIDKAVVEGSATQVGQKLMRIEDHSTLWSYYPC